MKKICYLFIAALLISGSVMAQDQEPEKKKKGGFMKALKKGVESTTGLKVSDETLFVYPTIGEWKMQVANCKGNPTTGEVILQINATRLTGDGIMDAWCNLREASITGGSALTLHRRSADPHYRFEVGKTIEVTFQSILGVPTDTKSIDVRFEIIDKSFEARRVPIEWE